MTNLFLIGLLQNKILEELDDVVFSNDDIDLPDTDSGIVTFFSNETGVITTDFDNINLDDDHFDKMILKLLLMLDLWLDVIEITRQGM